MFILCIKFDEDQLLHLLTYRMVVPYPRLELWRRVETAAVATIGICPYGTYCSSKHLPHKAVVGTIETSFVLGAKNGSSWQFLSIYLSIYLSVYLLSSIHFSFFLPSFCLAFLLLSLVFCALRHPYSSQCPLGKFGSHSHRKDRSDNHPT